MNYYFFKAKSMGLLLFASASINLMLCAIASAQSEPTQILDTNSQTENNKPQFSNIVNNFELNITNQQINQQNYQASTSIAVGQLSKNGINLNIGASVQASQIKMQLRNIYGQVHFRASSKRLQ
ncbi:hypothetical protein Cri9333_3606 [Crinalium epipsammum PCC 9333]|uniref:Filamentous hemagglutinin outer membrane protein n=1 Tax=Crinalium epipsammum PCC 9333 TaxID=1173022 RepID=K9W246_9CYAN|nr:hypothetical protein [Crinalium epipsammum]AFZ14428.1 hypothetical protein Cri9333_3606 [Crinalium epipsammum PCC 9333]